tara:strand:+ start:29660 stop:29977 length:318 start_codon:yes stop_codon:yes gene_type:complete
MVLSIKIAILQGLLALLIGVNNAEATTNSHLLLDNKLSIEGFSFSIGADKADLDDDTDFYFLKQTQLDTIKHVSILISLFVPQKTNDRSYSAPPIRAPPLPTHNT